MNTISVTIEKPIHQVWDFYTNLPNWRKWCGIAPRKVVPGWQTGGRLVFKSGEEDDCVNSRPMYTTHDRLGVYHRYELDGPSETSLSVLA